LRSLIFRFTRNQITPILKHLLRLWTTRDTRRGGLESKSLRGKRFYKGHRDIAENASHHFKKALIPLKMYLQSLAILEKASISIKK
jgi:hypothetical protein